MNNSLAIFVELTDGTELTWMRQPHYYMGLYSYTYSLWINNWYSCFTKIKQEGQPDAWLETLKAGGSQSPIELAKLQVLISLQMHHLKLLLNISLI